MDATMIRSIVLGMVLCSLWTSSAIAEDYLLRVDAIGFVDRPASERDLPETTLRSVEIVVRPDSTFHTKTVIGAETVIVSGKLSPKNTGGFSLQIFYARTVDTGIILPNEQGIMKPLLHIMSVNTTIAIAIDESVVLGGIETKHDDMVNPIKHSKTRITSILTKHKPHRD